MPAREEEAFLAAQNFEEPTRAFGQLRLQVFLLLNADAHDHDWHVQLFKDEGFRRSCIAGSQKIGGGKQAQVEILIEFCIGVRRIEAVGQMPERNVGHIVAAHCVGRALTYEIIARIGNLLDLIDHILLGADGLEIGAMLHFCPGNAFDGPHQI